MRSEKQIEANRKNAKKSTGPNTTEGKAVVAQNAVRHGILSAQVAIDEEEKELFETFFEVMQKELCPKSEFQAFLVDRIISTAWRLRRIVHVETLLLQKANNCIYSPSYSTAFEGQSSNDMAVLSRYERSLENTLFRAIKEFTSMQEGQELEVFEISNDRKNGFVSQNHSCNDLDCKVL